MPKMLRHVPILAGLFVFRAWAGDVGVHSSSEALGNWPQWRGPLANGVAPYARPPVHCSKTNNVRWKLPLAGKSHSPPIVFGDSIFLMGAVPVGDAQKPVYDSAPGTHDSLAVTHRPQS